MLVFLWSQSCAVLCTDFNAVKYIFIFHSHVYKTYMILQGGLLTHLSCK